LRDVLQNVLRDVLPQRAAALRAAARKIRMEKPLRKW